MPKPIHYFFALAPSEKDRHFLEDRISLFRGRGWERFGTFIPSDDLHLTLRFLGALPDEAAVALQAGAAGIARRTAPFAYTIGPCHLFPRVSRARIIAARVSAGDELPRLAQDLNSLCDQAGLPAEERLFRPHITLARLRNQMKRPNLPSRPGQVTAEASSFSLFRTNTAGGPASYEELASFPLQGTTPSDHSPPSPPA